MTYIIAEPCVGLKDSACVDVCPVDCIYTRDQDDMYYISPDECIDCGACEPACPWEAIFQDDSVPDVFTDDIELNVKCDEDRDSFETAENDPDTHKPSAEEIASNKEKYGYS